MSFSSYYAFSEATHVCPTFYNLFADWNTSWLFYWHLRRRHWWSCSSLTGCTLWIWLGPKLIFETIFISACQNPGFCRGSLFSFWLVYCFLIQSSPFSGICRLIVSLQTRDRILPSYLHSIRGGSRGLKELRQSVSHPPHPSHPNQIKIPL